MNKSLRVFRQSILRFVNPMRRRGLRSKTSIGVTLAMSAWKELQNCAQFSVMIFGDLEGIWKPWRPPAPQPHELP